MDSVVAAIEHIDTQSTPVMVVCDLAAGSAPIEALHKGLQSGRTSLAPIIVVFANSVTKQQKSDLFFLGVDEVVTFSEWKLFGSARLAHLRRRLNERAALLDSTQVLERYAHHIDIIAADRARQLVHAERLSTLGTLSASIAHEIKTPMGYIATSLETANIFLHQLAQTPTPAHQKPPPIAPLIEKIHQALTRIDHGVERVQRLTKGLKKFSRSGSEGRRVVVLGHCIRQALELCEGITKAGLELSVNGPDISSPVWVDPVQIEQVIVNLIVNAGDALERTIDGKITLHEFADDSHCGFVLEDNGPGISPEKLSSIWQPFFTTKGEEKGTGLGLAISKNIIEAHRGTITVENLASGGARFTVTLPTAQPDEYERIPATSFEAHS